MEKRKKRTIFTYEYWTSQINPDTGTYYTKEEAKIKRTEITGVRHSPFSMQYWLEKINPETGKLYTEAEADFKRRSQRKNDKCYWLLQINPETGEKYTEQEAIIKAKDFHQKISDKGAQKAKETDAYYKNPEKRTNRIEYYLNQGMTYDEAKEALTNRQRTFSKEKCIERYGEDGLKVWEERQNNWQNTLNSKSKSEKKDINKKKACDYRFYLKETTQEEKQEIFTRLKEKGWTLFDTEDEFISYIREDYVTNKQNYYNKPLDYLKTFPKLAFAYFGRTAKYYVKFIKEFDKVFDVVKSSNGFYTKKTEYGLLRSGLEIAMYDIIQELGLEIESLDKPYPNSTLRYDFKINGTYVELCGKMYDVKYRANMFYKRNTFNSVLVLPSDDFRQFFIDYFINKDDERINYYNSRPI